MESMRRSNNPLSVANDNKNGTHIEDPVSLVRARHHYNDLFGLLGQLSNKLSGVSANVDKEFLASYRVHMLSIQSEIKNLKLAVTRGEQILNDDVQVARLENEAKWFSDECMRLRSHYDAMSHDCKQMKVRLRDMVEQKEYLGAQLKALVKRNKVLRENVLELMKNQQDRANLQQLISAQHQLNNQGNEELYQDEDDEEEYPGEDYDDQDDELYEEDNYRTNNKANKHIMKSASQAIIPTNNNNRNSSKHTHSMPQLLQRTGTSDTNQLHIPDTAAQRNKHTRDKYSQPRSRSPEQVDMNADNFNPLNIKSPEVKKQIYTMQLSQLKDQRESLELTLQDSIREIYEEIHARKLKAKQMSSTRLPTLRNTQNKSGIALSARTNDTSASKLKSNYHSLKKDDIYGEHRVQLPPLIAQSGGLSGLGTDQFTDNDRFAAMVKFLSHRDILEQVVQTLEEMYS